MNTLKNDIEKFIELRMEKGLLNLRSDKDYMDTYDRYTNIIEKIKEQLNDNELFLDFESTEILLYNLQIKKMYQVGFCDGLNIGTGIMNDRI